MAMEFTDTHTHPYVEEFDADRAESVRRALAAGVTRMVLPNIDVASIAPMRALAAQFPDNMRMAMGLHPSEVGADWQSALAEIEAEFDRNASDYIAVGEVGIDLYWSREFRHEQMLVLERQLAMAADRGLPAIIHCREGLDECLEVMQSFPGLQLLFHCFSGTEADVDRIRAQFDAYFGIGGVVTFKNSVLAGVLPHIGADRIVLETDAPYLASVPHRGRRNESAYLPLTAAKVASALGMTTAEVADVTAANSRRLLGF